MAEHGPPKHVPTCGKEEPNENLRAASTELLTVVVYLYREHRPILKRKGNPTKTCFAGRDIFWEPFHSSCFAICRPSATISRIGLIESRLRCCHGGPPLAGWPPLPGWTPPPHVMDGWGARPLRWLSVLAYFVTTTADRQERLITSDHCGPIAGYGKRKGE